jgi:hypothetical protein
VKKYTYLGREAHLQVDDRQLAISCPSQQPRPKSVREARRRHDGDRAARLR